MHTDTLAHSTPLVATRPASRRRTLAGFTLIETLVAMAVAAVLSGIAFPSFEGQLQRARRSDALVSVMLVQLAEERFRANGRTYGSLAEIGSPGRSTAGHYALQLTSASELGYEVLASANGAQARDASCRHLRLSMTGGNADYASGPDASVTNPDAANRKCWSR